MRKVELPVVNRSCGECRKCCEGWLSASIYGKFMSKGQPCYYLGDGCTIYEERPEEPCRKYECMWIESEVFPMWMKPSVSGVIVTRRVVEGSGVLYYTVLEAGRKIESSVLNWVVQWALGTQSNIHYEVGGKSYMIGSSEFISLMNRDVSGVSKRESV